MANPQKPARFRGTWYANYLNNIVRILGFVLLVVAAVFIYRALFNNIAANHDYIPPYIALWIFSAYIFLPRMYRFFSGLYLPSYFFGRTQTSGGLLGDPINIALYGDREQLLAAMESAGWHLADKLTFRSAVNMMYATIFGKEYPTAPVSSLFLFDRKQDFAFEKSVGGNPRRRHHVRFWKTPQSWWLPGGYQADWLAAATFDTHIGLSLFTGQVTHKIDANIDEERDFVVESLQRTGLVTQTTRVEHFTSGYHARNAGGDVIHTDGTMPFVALGD